MSSNNLRRARKGGSKTSINELNFSKKTVVKRPLTTSKGGTMKTSLKMARRGGSKTSIPKN